MNNTTCDEAIIRATLEAAAEQTRDRAICGYTWTDTDVQSLLAEIDRNILSIDPASIEVPDISSDDRAVNAFSEIMKSKLLQKSIEGRGGWDDPEQCSVEELATSLVKHLPKGDPVDIANFCMMLHQRGADKRVLASVFEASIEVPSPWVSVEDRLPEKIVPVLVFHSGFMLNVGEFFPASEIWIVGRKAEYEVTHWMPLPPLPEGK